MEHVERFRKRRNFDFWAGMQSVDEAMKARLRAMFLEASPGARAALAPEESDGHLTFYLDEILIASVKAPR